MSVFNEEAMEITWPHELVNFLTSKGFTVEQTEFDKLKAGDVAIVLIKRIFIRITGLHTTKSKIQ